MNTLIILTFLAAAIPALLFLLNLRIYKPLPKPEGASSPVSVLIPARNEETNISGILESVLASHGVEFEIVVLDDHSTDRTATIVESFRAKDRRVRLEFAPPLPSGWCGKQHACHILSTLAKHPLLLFLDADVRVAPDALARMTGAMRGDVAMLSGVPKQELETFSGKLLIPLIHHVLMGYLPMHLMRWTTWPAFSGGCGQLFLVRKSAYELAGGHAAIRHTLHDGLKLPRLLRQAGFRTDLFDATNTARCRMFTDNAEVWRGLGRNATEGLAAPLLIWPMTVLLGGSGVMPYLLLAFLAEVPFTQQMLILSSLALSLLPRILSVRRFQHPWSSAWLHPLGILGLLSIQWQAWLARALGKPSRWKGRSYDLTPADEARSISRAAGIGVMLLGLSLSVAHAADGTGLMACRDIQLQDQFGAKHVITFPRTNLTVLVIADRKGSEQIEEWVATVKKSSEANVAIYGVADLHPAPKFLHGFIRSRFQDKYPTPILLDWTGRFAAELQCTPGQANFFLLDTEGRVIERRQGPATPASSHALSEAIERCHRRTLKP